MARAPPELSFSARGASAGSGPGESAARAGAPSSAVRTIGKMEKVSAADAAVGSVRAGRGPAGIPKVRLAPQLTQRIDLTGDEGVRRPGSRR